MRFQIQLDDHQIGNLPEIDGKDWNDMIGLIHLKGDSGFSYVDISFYYYEKIDKSWFEPGHQTIAPLATQCMHLNIQETRALAKSLLNLADYLEAIKNDA